MHAPRWYLLYKTSYTQFCLKFATGLVVVEFDWHHSIAHPRILSTERKRHRDISIRAKSVLSVLPQFSLPWQPGSVVVKFDWHHVITCPGEPTGRRKHLGDISYRRRVIGDFTLNLVAMATGLVVVEFVWRMLHSSLLLIISRWIMPWNKAVFCLEILIYKCDVIMTSSAAMNIYFYIIRNYFSLEVYSLQFLFKSTHHTWSYERKCELVFFSNHSVYSFRVVWRCLLWTSGAWASPQLTWNIEYVNDDFEANSSRALTAVHSCGQWKIISSFFKFICNSGGSKITIYRWLSTIWCG